jgi:CO/xanthine dehydrogenase FAD-binding subunit
LGERLPGLAIASRTVGSPQIRNRGTIGGNLGTSSPAGDGLPPLYASDAEVELVSTNRRRRVPIDRFITGPKRNSLAPGELIAAFLIPEAEGPQQFAKIGTRNAMVIAVCSLALALHPSERRVAACVGSAGPTPIRALDAEAFIAGVLEEDDLWELRRPLVESVLRRFGELVELAARPISDVRGTAAYRLHAVGVLGQRTLRWAWDDYCDGSR